MGIVGVVGGQTELGSKATPKFELGSKAARAWVQNHCTDEQRTSTEFKSVEQRFQGLSKELIHNVVEVIDTCDDSPQTGAMNNNYPQLDLGSS